MQPCQEYEALISAAIDGEVTEEERRTLMEHLSRCEGCREAYTQSLLLHEAFDQWEEEAPAGLAEAVMEQVHREPRQRSRTRSRRRWMSLAAAAACLALIVVGFRVGQTLEPAVSYGEEDQSQVQQEDPAVQKSIGTDSADADDGQEQPVQDPDPAVGGTVTQYETGKVEDSQTQSPPVQDEQPPEQNGQPRLEAPQVTAFAQNTPVMTVTCSDPGILTWMEENIAQEGTASGEETVWTISAADWMKLEVRLLDGGCTYEVTGEKTSDEIVDGDLVQVVCRIETEA